MSPSWDMRDDQQPLAEIEITVRQGMHVYRITCITAKAPAWMASPRHRELNLWQVLPPTGELIGADCQLTFFATPSEDGTCYQIEEVSQ